MILSFLTCVIRFMKIIMKSAGGHFQLMWYIMLFVCQFNVLYTRFQGSGYGKNRAIKTSVIVSAFVGKYPATEGYGRHIQFYSS